MATDHDRLARALAGADYPADKQDLQDLARQNGAVPLPQLLAWLAQQGI